ncbi:MAG: hypothetical protein H6748_16010 [Spirochaetaceae bacterium]|nr:hypothetical protein [Spirochaetaceae bacterium]
MAKQRFLTIVAQDPSIRDERGILTAQVALDAEALLPGPRGSRVHVIDYDASTSTLYQPYEYPKDDPERDPFEKASTKTVLRDPGFHAQNAYAIVMKMLARFEFALGRGVAWGFGGHQIKVAPHAFADANAFYSRDDEALCFGYFPARDGGTIFTCLSHDVVAHEATHALLDGIRASFIEPSSPDQAAFHEGFSDLCALLSVFSMRDVVAKLLDHGLSTSGANEDRASGLVSKKALTRARLKKWVLLGLAEDMGSELSRIRGSALRRSLDLEPSGKYLDDDEFQHPHRRGEILVAAVLQSFLDTWLERIRVLAVHRGGWVDRERVVEEASEIAEYLLTMLIRALDYAPPIHINFGDFLSAVLTADHEIRPDDQKYGFRERLRESFSAFGIEPGSDGKGRPEAGLWRELKKKVSYQGLNFEPLRSDPNEMFRFVWENRRVLGFYEGAYIQVESIRPCCSAPPRSSHLVE